MQNRLNLRKILLIAKISDITMSEFHLSMSVNIRGRCGFGQPCDQNRLSYGCEGL